MTADLLDLVLSWRALLVAMLVFGFAPGVVLRAIVLAFHRDDPRRAELLAELRAVPFVERPLWVAQQFEVAVFEGLGERVLSFAAGKLFWRWRLESGVESNRRWPDTFELPTDDEKASVGPGCYVKLMFRSTDDWRERMWVKVTKVGRRRVIGRVANTPFAIPGLSWNQKVRFQLDDVIDIDLALDAGDSLSACD